ncbi:ParB/Srx family N-terminal domain-containing protein [Sphingorhabdus buctiana]|uniref:ParB/Srx family N-terminal domain-containing protein n=1 Tax=Sphingorhabdus buctiana TaxID=1508805 RepID=A0ABW4ME50_9SPHN
MRNHAHKIANRPISELKAFPGNARTHSKKQIQQIARSIKQFGFNNPVLVGDDDTIIAGHGRVAAAELVGMAEVPTIKLSHLNAAERRAYVLADNKLAQNAGWDSEVLALEMQSLIDLDFDLSLTGFETVEIDQVLDDWAASSSLEEEQSEDQIPELAEQVVTQPGDMWQLGLDL